MKNTLTVYINLLLATLLFGCGGSSTDDAETQGSFNKPASVIAGEENSNNTARHQEGFLDGLVGGADLIVHGTATDMTTKMSIEGIPYIFTTYKIHEVVSGEYKGGDTITVKFVGGEYPNGNRLTATNSPNIQIGQESVFMIQKHKDTGCEFVRCMEGYFTIENGQIVAANESAIVVNNRGDVEYISLSARSRGKYKSSLQKMNVNKFKTHLKSLTKKLSGLNKGRQAPVDDNDLYASFHAYKGLTKAGRAPVPPKSVAKNTVQNKGSAFDQWEEQALREGGGNPVLNQYYPGE